MANQDILDMLLKMNDRFDKMNDRFDKMNDKFDKMNDKFDVKFNDTNSRLEKLSNGCE